MGERLEEIESYSEVVLSRSEAAGSEVGSGEAVRRRRRSGAGGRVRTGRGDALDHEEAILGVDLGRGGAEQGVPW